MGSHFKLTHYVCREHTDRKEGVEPQEMRGGPSEPAIRSRLEGPPCLLRSTPSISRHVRQLPAAVLLIRFGSLASEGR